MRLSGYPSSSDPRETDSKMLRPYSRGKDVISAPRLGQEKRNISPLGPRCVLKGHWRSNLPLFLRLWAEPRLMGHLEASGKYELDECAPPRFSPHAPVCRSQGSPHTGAGHTGTAMPDTTPTKRASKRSIDLSMGTAYAPPVPVFGWMATREENDCGPEVTRRGKDRSGGR